MLRAAYMRRCILHLALLVLFCVLLGVPHLAKAIGPNPAENWRTAQSAHFIIHFVDAQRPYAERALQVAEKVYGPVTKALNWEPYEPTHIALLGNIDLANGYATPLPFNQMGIFLTPPDFTDDLVRGDWLELVIHHEFTHIIHLDKSAGAPRWLRNVFGRFPWLYPNIFQPRWMVEGLATYSESAPELGIGRLRGPFFEAWMRDERQRGFRSLRELNADGRNPPIFSAYLYGAYFFDFLSRRYGQEAVRKLVESYSDNLLPFRLHSVPYEVTGKMMDELYDEFIDDLTKEIDGRSADVLKEPAAVGSAMGHPYRDVWGIAAGRGQDSDSLYAVTDDGITEPRLQRFAQDGKVFTLAASRYGTRIDARADGAVLASQIEVCEGHDLYYDLYLIQPHGSGWFGPERLTHCGRYFRGVWSAGGEGIFALKHEAGRQLLVHLDAQGHREEVLLTGAGDMQWIDLAAAPDGKRLALVGKSSTQFGLFEFDLASRRLRTLHSDATFKHSPQFNGEDLYFLSATGNVFNIWRLTRGNALERVTHAHTGVLAFGGTDAQGRMTLATLEQGQIQVRRATAAAALQALPVQATEADRAAPAPSALPVLTTPVKMEAETGYSALSTLAPRSWFPVLFADRNMIAAGVTTFGSDVLGWHRYSLTPLFEFTQQEPLGVFEYVYHDRHYFTFDRNLAVTRWRDDGNRDKATEYERSMQAQWISLARLIRWDYRVNAGIGAALEQKDRVTIDGGTQDLDDERVAAGLLEFENLHQNIYSEGPSQGLRARVLYETYRPFKGGTRYDGNVLRFDLQTFIPIGKTVLALRGVEARAHDRTESFELGGEFSEFSGEAPRLNERKLALRGYDRGLAQLRGPNARLGSVELRFPFADVDRHFMVPPIGLNRLSGVVFMDIGRVSGNGIDDSYRKGVGFELLGEIRVGYLFGVQLRAGVARGLNAPGSTEAYLQIGRGF